MSIVLQSTGGGSVTINEPTTASNFTQTLPASTGTVMVSGNMPAFSAYAGSGTSLTGGTSTKVLFDTEEFDTNNNFASSRFTPTVAGYYQINGCFDGATSSRDYQCYIFKNGSVYKAGIEIITGGWGQSVSSLVYCNGSTDYIEIYAYSNTTTTTSTGMAKTWFNGSMVRAA
jgi:hypothetical protein